MILNKLVGLFSNDMGIDLGTANTLIYVKDVGVVLREPSVVAVKSGSRRVLAVGDRAKQMLGRTPKDIIAIRPMRDGVIADFDVVEEMIRYFIKKVHNRRLLLRPRIVIGVPSGITEVERRAVRESAEKAGAREIYLIEESFAAAIGADIPIHEAAGNMVVDIGGGTTEVSVISLGGMVVSNSIRVGGNKFDDKLTQYIKNQHGLVVGDRTVEEVKIKIGTAYPSVDLDRKKIEIRGRDSSTGLPKILEMDAIEIRDSFKEPLNEILRIIVETLDQTPPELSADIHERGIIMTGGGSLLRGLSKFIAMETLVPVLLAKKPLDCVVIGTGRFLEEVKNFNYEVV